MTVKPEIWINLKNGYEYLVVGLVFSANNDRPADGVPEVLYQRVNTDKPNEHYRRRGAEFFAKFKRQAA